MPIRRPKDSLCPTAGKPFVGQAKRIADRRAEKATDNLIFPNLGQTSLP